MGILKPSGNGFWKGFMLGVVAVGFVLMLGGYSFISLGLMPTHADEFPSALEKWAARKSLEVTLHREASRSPAPIRADEPNLLTGLKLYKANCLVCHGAADAEASNVADGLYQKPPQFAARGVSDDPEGEIAWFIRHGVRLTGMPAFSPTLDESEILKITVFLKHLDALPPKVQKAWKAVPSASY